MKKNHTHLYLKNKTTQKYDFQVITKNELNKRHPIIKNELT